MSRFPGKKRTKRKQRPLADVDGPAEVVALLRYAHAHERPNLRVVSLNVYLNNNRVLNLLF